MKVRVPKSSEKRFGQAEVQAFGRQIFTGIVFTSDDYQSRWITAWSILKRSPPEAVKQEIQSIEKRKRANIESELEK